MSQVKSSQKLETQIEVAFRSHSVSQVGIKAVSLIEESVYEIESYTNKRDLISFTELEESVVDLMIRADARRKLWAFVSVISDESCHINHSWKDFLINLDSAISRKILEISLSGATALEGSRGVGARILKSNLKDLGDEVMDMIFDELAEAKKAERN